ncbi:MAG: glucose-6-phosphate dehydrogenase [Dermatophilaceae bacterium]
MSSTEARGTGGNHAFYLSIPPGFFAQVCQQLDRSGLATPSGDGWRRVVIEKPFGHDLESARELNAIVGSVFPPDSVFRIDHYLGKETVQNLLALRFANQLFEPVWNAHYVDHVQITMAEDIGIGGRAGYYDGIGAARDVIQNHLLQLLALTAMEEPASFDADSPALGEGEGLWPQSASRGTIGRHTARGQYAAGWQGSRGGHRLSRRRTESSLDSTTETYAAVRLDIDDPPLGWRAVLSPHRQAPGQTGDARSPWSSRRPHICPSKTPRPRSSARTRIVIRVQPDEGVTIRFGAKVPGAHMEVRDVTMDFGYGNAFTESSPEAYERLILDVLLGEPPLFPRHEEVELSWKILDPIEAWWAAHGTPEQYESGGWGPSSSDEMLARDGRVWRMP